MRSIARVAVAAGSLVAVAPPALGQEVKFEKYKLENGLTVILHEDHSLPTVTINTWFHVGSKDEPVHRSGFAHLFEHLMFMGTERVPGNQFDVIMESGGGANNASTSFDRTNYFSDGPSALLPTLLWLDADRLEDLGRTMTREKLDRQRDVVRNERRQSIENQPYGKAELEITAIMFPGDHPYHNEVIGTHEDLEAANVQNVKDFFAAYYVPNNASLVVAGDFDPAKVKPLIKELYATIAKGAEPAHVTAPAVTLGRVVRAVTLDQVQLPKVEMCYHSPAQMSDGDAEMDLAGAVLAQGKSSRLYKRLVLDDKIAVDVAAYQNSAALQSIFRIDVTPAPGQSLDHVEAVIDEEVGRLLKDGVTKEELDQRIATIELGKLSALQSVARVADKLNEYEFFWGKPDGFKRDLDRYRTATPASVLAWAKRVLTQDSRLVMRVLPAEPEREASARDKRPADFQAATFTPPAPETFTLKNGVPVMLFTNSELPLASVHIVFTPGGPLDDPAHAGRSTLTAQMLGEGAGPYSAEQFADAVQSLGATFRAGAGNESADVSLFVVKRNLGKAMDLVRLAVREPSMTPTDWERVQRLHLEGLKQQDDQPTAVAARVGQRLLFGDENPYAWFTGGTPETVKALTLDAVKQWRGTLFAPAHLTIIVGGDITRADAEKLLDPLFGDWKGGEPRGTAPALEPKASEGLRVAVVDRPGAVQTVVRYVTPGIRRGDEHRVAYEVLNTILGGSFTSRLNQNLREAHGYTYGAGSAYFMEPSAGYFSARSSVRADVTGASLAEFAKEFARIQRGDITPEEAGKAIETVRTGTIHSFEGVNGPVGQAADVVVAGLPYATIAGDLAATSKVTAEQLNALAKAALPIDRGVLVLVGDKATILGQLKDLGLPAPVEYDIHGEPVKSK